jgi:hypothetical protein
MTALDLEARVRALEQVVGRLTSPVEVKRDPVAWARLSSDDQVIGTTTSPAAAHNWVVTLGGDRVVELYR